MDGLKKREAELVLARHVIDARGAVLGMFICKKECGPLLPVIHLWGIGESIVDGRGIL